MIELKVYCDCGQKYKFEVEPVNGQMPFTVACPICKRDGTAKANQTLQQLVVFKPIGVEPNTVSAAVAPPPAPAYAAAPAPAAPRVSLASPPPPLRTGVTPAAAPVAVLAAAPTPTARPVRTSGVPQQDPAQLEAEARAKILWGDRPDEVIHFLMLRGLTNEEASAKVHAMIKERSRTIRAKGLVKFIGGTLTTLGAAGAMLTMLKVGFFSPFVLGGVGLAAVGGLWLIFNGLWKIIAPGAQSGDASDND
jgi:hypothetical protein